MASAPGAVRVVTLVGVQALTTLAASSLTKGASGTFDRGHTIVHELARRWGKQQGRRASANVTSHSLADRPRNVADGEEERSC